MAALYTSLASIWTLLALLMLMWLAYSLIGMQLFSGELVVVRLALSMRQHHPMSNT